MHNCKICVDFTLQYKGNQIHIAVETATISALVNDGQLVEIANTLFSSIAIHLIPILELGCYD